MPAVFQRLQIRAETTRIRHRDDHEAQLDPSTHTAIPCPLGNERSDMATRGEPTQAHPIRIHAQLARMGADVLESIPAVLQGDREAELGCETVVDVDDYGRSGDADGPDERVVVPCTSNHPAAAVEVDVHRRRRGGGRSGRAVNSEEDLVVA